VNALRKATYGELSEMPFAEPSKHFIFEQHPPRGGAPLGP
jgi:hypothetical protein